MSGWSISETVYDPGHWSDHRHHYEGCFCKGGQETAISTATLVFPRCNMLIGVKRMCTANDLFLSVRSLSLLRWALARNEQWSGNGSGIKDVNEQADVALVVLALAGCATNAKTHAARGVSGIKVDCSGLGNGWEKCHKQATKECKGSGCKVVLRSDDAQEEDDFLFGFNPAGYLMRTMLVICR
jgi:hypothetical protein